MKRPVVTIAVISLLATSLAGVPISARAQAADAGKPAAQKMETPGNDAADASKGEKKKGAIPFNGKIAAIDKVARTFKVGERTFAITPETKITKDGKLAKLEEAAIGDAAGGNYKLAEGGRLEVQMVRFGPKPEDAAKGEGKVTTRSRKKAQE